MLTLRAMLQPLTIPGLLSFAHALDPNSSWDEWIESDPSIDAQTLRDAMLAAYDDADTHAWLNR